MRVDDAGFAVENAPYPDFAVNVHARVQAVAAVRCPFERDRIDHPCEIKNAIAATSTGVSGPTVKCLLNDGCHDRTGFCPLRGGFGVARQPVACRARGMASRFSRRFPSMALTLAIGNKNYSSWSMRPWMALKVAGIDFDEVVIPLYTGAPDKQRILNFTKSGKVPALVDGDITVWDSLAIIEYAAERFPDARLWPQDRGARAHARSISAGNAFGLHAVAQRMRHEHPSSGPIKAAFRRRGRQHCPHPADMDRVPRDVWRAGAVFCSARSPAPMRCTHRSSIGFALTTLK